MTYTLPLIYSLYTKQTASHTVKCPLKSAVKGVLFRLHQESYRYIFCPRARFILRCGQASQWAVANYSVCLHRIPKITYIPCQLLVLFIWPCSLSNVHQRAFLAKKKYIYIYQAQLYRSLFKQQGGSDLNIIPLSTH